METEIIKRLATSPSPSLIAIAVLCVLAGSPGVALAQDSHQNELIPLYDNANPSDWSTACSEVDGAGDGSLIIADPVDSGPGTAPIPAWTNVIHNCYAYGRASVIGYVWTDYGEGGMAAIPAIENEIKSWYAFYHGDIAGIFFDGVSDTVPGTSTVRESFYTGRSHVTSSGRRGTTTPCLTSDAETSSDWMLDSSNTENADIVVTFEGSYDTPGEDPYTAWTQAGWEQRYPAEDFAALVYNTTSFGLPPQPATVCDSLGRQNLGYVYVGTS